LCARDCHIEAIDAEKKLDVSGKFVVARSGHRDKADGCLLPLKLIDRADAAARRKRPRQQIDLSIVGRDDEDIILIDLANRSIAVPELLANERPIGIANSAGLLLARLAVTLILCDPLMITLGRGRSTAMKTSMMRTVLQRETKRQRRP
jgi:hypothetical protein